MLTDYPSGAKLDSILGAIKDIVDILKDVVEIAGSIAELMTDCSGSTTVSDRDVRDGIEIPGASQWIGYVMKQKGVIVDFKQTQTKIKGKAKVWKENKRGKKKKDRRNKASITFCAKEWNQCEGKEWPSDAGFYSHPIVTKRKKAKIKFFQPNALVIDKSYHYVQFGFGRNGIYVTSLNLLGSTGCRNSSNTNW